MATNDDEPRASSRLDNLASGPANPDDDQKSSPKKEKEDEGKGDKVTVQMDPELAQKLRAAVYYTPGLTMYQVVEKGVAAVIDKLEKDRGEPFPEFEGNLKGGRPPKDAPGVEL